MAGPPSRNASPIAPATCARRSAASSATRRRRVAASAATRRTFSRGHICPKAAALKDLHEDPDRLRRPVPATANGWDEIGWDEAFDLVATRLPRCSGARPRRRRRVPGQPDRAQPRAMLYAPHSCARSARGTGTRRRRSTSSRTCSPRRDVRPPAPDAGARHRSHVVLADPRREPARVERQPDDRARRARRLKAIRARGGAWSWSIRGAPRPREVADAPPLHPAGQRRAACCSRCQCSSPTARRASSRLTAASSGSTRPSRPIAPFSPERVAAATGFPAGTSASSRAIRGGAERAVVYGRIGVSTQEFGGLPVARPAAQRADRHLDAPGGAMFTTPALDHRGHRLVGRGGFGEWRSRVRGLPEFGGELPVAALAEEIETPGEGQIRALVTIAGNPVLSTPNGAPPRARARRPRLHGLDRHLRERDDAARARDPAADLGAGARSLRRGLPRARGAQHRAA